MSTGELSLVLEASTGTGSLALIREKDVVASAEVAMRGRDGEQLMPAVVHLLDGAGITSTDIRRIDVGGGPGGFTSLRIAAAIGKGLAESLGVPMWGMSSLALLAAGRAGEDGGDEVIAILDAMRGEWFARRFSGRRAEMLVPRGGTMLVTRDALAELAAQSGARIVGVGGGSFARGVEAVPQARDVINLPEGELLHPIDLERWEPDYGRLAEAQVKWEQSHGRALGSAG